MDASPKLKSHRVRFSGRKTNILIFSGSLAVSAIMAFAAGEAYIRLTKPYVTPDTVREKSLEYEPTLFARHAFPKMTQTMRWRGGTGNAKINNKGYRGKDFQIPKPKGRTRMIFLGGSAAFDTHAPEGKDWPHLVEKGLWQNGYKEVECINASVPGHATWDSLGRLYSEIWMFQPDYIFVYHAWNDIKYFKWLNPDQSLLRGYRPAVRKDRIVGNPFMYYTGPIDRLLCLSQLYIRLRWRYWSWRIGLIGPEGLIRIHDEEIPGESVYPGEISKWGQRQFELNLRLICAAARDIGATPVLMTQARLPTADNLDKVKGKIRYGYVRLNHVGLVNAFEACDRTVRAVGKAENVNVLDLSKKLSGNEKYFVDHVHTTPVGSAAIAKEVVQFCLQFLLQGYKSSEQDTDIR